MTVRRLQVVLPGHENDSSGCWCIDFCFRSGIQGVSHPNPGKYFSGTNRQAFLPDSVAGNRVLELFKLAWTRKLMFTVGRSLTTGADNCVVWNGIHCKTALDGGPSAHGFPDVDYLERVTVELAAQGVSEEKEPVTPSVPSFAPVSTEEQKSRNAPLPPINLSTPPPATAPPATARRKRRRRRQKRTAVASLAQDVSV